MKVKTLAANALVAALYIAVSLLIQPISYGPIQFRIPEIFNHLIVFSKKYFFGIIVGVFITNLFSPYGIYDLVFGLGHSVISLAIVLLICRHLKNSWVKMSVNTLVFTFNIFIVAFEIHLLLHVPFLWTWLTTAAGEFAIMAIGIPIMQLLNRRLHFKRLIS